MRSIFSLNIDLELFFFLASSSWFLVANPRYELKNIILVLIFGQIRLWSTEQEKANEGILAAYPCYK